jgi:hypothetical protein
MVAGKYKRGILATKSVAAHRGRCLSSPSTPGGAAAPGGPASASQPNPRQSPQTDGSWGQLTMNQRSALSRLTELTETHDTSRLRPSTRVSREGTWARPVVDDRHQLHAAVIASAEATSVDARSVLEPMTEPPQPSPSPHPAGLARDRASSGPAITEVCRVWPATVRHIGPNSPARGRATHLVRDSDPGSATGWA